MKNMIYVYSSTLILAIMNFVVRRVFLDVLTIDYLGYDGLFGSIFSFLSLSEMGIASIITYHMYSEIASSNTDRIRKLLYIYKLVYRIVGIFVLVAGIAVSTIIPFILNGSQKDSWLFIYSIYFLQLLATLCTYFLAYRRILFVTHQRIYVCTSVDTLASIFCIVLKMVVLIIFKNYILYLCIAIFQNISTNMIIAYLSKKEYPQITKIAITKKDIKELNLLNDIKNMMATKIAMTVYGGSDDIIISSILGVSYSGLLSNYRMISSKLQEFILSIFNSLQASIGNLVYDKDSQKGKSFFKALDLLGFYMGLVCSVGVVTLGQKVIVLWLKNEAFLLPYLFLILLSVNMYIALSNNPMAYFRNSLGHFEIDRNYMIAAAITNVVLSIILAFPLGISGVMAGTVIGHLIIFAGRTKVVFEFYLKEKPTTYFLQFALRFLYLIISALICIGLSKILEKIVLNSILYILVCGIISVIVSTLIFVITSFKSDAFRVLWQYLITVISMISQKKSAK